MRILTAAVRECLGPLGGHRVVVRCDTAALRKPERLLAGGT
jgi:hypothetical protein